MSRRKKGQIVNGWICLDKPFEMRSTEAVSKIRRLFDAQKAGHAGTLDPLASGILPIALGEATARAVQRIPDAHCNGDMHAALDYAAKVKHEQKDFLTRQGIESIYES